MRFDSDVSTHVVLDLERKALLLLATSLGLQAREAAVNDFRIKLCSGGYRVELIHFPEGKVIHPHRHKSKDEEARPLFKLLLRGRISYQEAREVLLPMQLAVVMEEVTYSGLVEEDSLLVLITPTTSVAVSDAQVD